MGKSINPMFDLKIRGLFRLRPRLIVLMSLQPVSDAVLHCLPPLYRPTVNRYRPKGGEFSNGVDNLQDKGATTLPHQGSEHLAAEPSCVTQFHGASSP